MELSGCNVTRAAMGCEKNIAKEIEEAELALQGNHEVEHEEVKGYPADAIGRGRGGGAAAGVEPVAT